jgi:hypothetical protein
MYIGAVIRFPDGKEKVVEANGRLALVKFMGAIGKHAKKENKIVKIRADNFNVLGMLRDQLPDTSVEYGNKGELKANEA